MSLAKAVPDGQNDHKCTKMALGQRPPIPYVPEKDSVQETASAYKDNHLKTLINKGTELRVPIGTLVRARLFSFMWDLRRSDQEKVYFKSYKEYSGTFADKCDKIKQLQSQLAELDETSGTYRKSNKNAKETTVEASSTSSTLRADIMNELKQAMEATEEATARRDKAAEDMFKLYANLLSVNARYAWNKIVQEQTNANPNTDLQGLTKKEPRGFLCKSFEDCVMFHLLTVFPNSAAEQERYYIMNVPKKPQCISICQFVQCVEQLNSYISQLPCWYYTPSMKPDMIPMNVPFAEPDLLSHVLQMCPSRGRISTTFTRKVGLL